MNEERDFLSDLLRDASVEVEESSEFNDRVIRRWKLEQHRKKMMYWAPTMAGAIVAGVGFLAMLQIMTAQPIQSPAELESQTAELELPTQNLPSLVDDAS
ncbi:MAG: hypothetical protein KDC26_07765 [Armatimonadetes bacterium]|nr:hypothetical protein [Armatimonadota bacterium]